MGKDNAVSGEWQPIETAPTARPILIYTPDPGEDSGYVDISWFSNLTTQTDYAWREVGGYCNIISTGPTHWMPLPEPPATP